MSIETPHLAATILALWDHGCDTLEIANRVRNRFQTSDPRHIEPTVFRLLNQARDARRQRRGG